MLNLLVMMHASYVSKYIPFIPGIIPIPHRTYTSQNHSGIIGAGLRRRPNIEHLPRTAKP